VCNSKRRDKKEKNMQFVKKKNAHDAKQVQTVSVDTESYTLFSVGASLRSPKPFHTDIQINGQVVAMEIDTGASVSILNESTLSSYNSKNKPTVKPCGAVLRTYTGEHIPVMGRASVNIRYCGQKCTLPILVVKGNGPNLIGRDWLTHLRLDWGQIKRLHVGNTEAEAIVFKYPEVFQEGLGTLKGTKGHIVVPTDAQPRYFKPRHLPYALRPKVDNELDRLEKEKTIEPVEFSDWAAPIVPVPKGDIVRICGDYKVTVNPVAKTDKYPLPRIEDLYANLAGGQKFSKLDLKNAYLQVELDDESKKYTTINTHRGLFQYNRLPFGISSAPGIFQRVIDNLLQGIPHTCAILDDILITGENDEEHLHNLDLVLKRLAKAELRLNKQKCIFMSPSVTYVGHIIDKEGLHPVEEKVRAIMEAPSPTNVTELKSYLGLFNYYGRFMPNLSTLLAPLHKLLKEKNPWAWTHDQQEAFDKSKQLLNSSRLLVHYDSNKELLLACDASPYGIGAVLSHIMPDGSEQPISFASRTLAPAEKKYSQLEKEGLAVVYGVKKFHNYLYGRHFTIQSDHKPLETLLSESKPIPPMASARIQRWALTLSAYNYTFTYRPGSKLGHADAMSRLPLPEYPTDIPKPTETILLTELLEDTPLCSDQISLWTARDPLMSQVLRYVQHGWPSDKPSEILKPYCVRKNELSIQDGCLLWGSRVVIPNPGRNSVLNLLHEVHPGIVRMKSLARNYIWWPGIDSDIENKVRNCNTCQQHRNKPASAPLHPWEWPEKPWVRLHLDYAGPFKGKMFLIIIDAHSKWMDVHTMNTSTTEATVERLRETFSTFGLPQSVVTDNGTCFTSSHFQKFMRANGIHHIKTAPYHPSSNGQAERAVQVFKDALKCMENGNIKTQVSRFLFRYRTTPQTTTGRSPAELLIGRKLRTHLDLLHPDDSEKVRLKQQNQKHYHDSRAKNRAIYIGDLVFVKNFASKGPNWLTGCIIDKTGPVSFLVELSDGRIVRRHQDHVRIRFNNESTESVDVNISNDIPVPVTSIVPVQATSTAVENQVGVTPDNENLGNYSDDTSVHTPTESGTVIIDPTPNDAIPEGLDVQSKMPRRSGRTSRPPRRFDDD